jgi:hypothetical protein
MIPCDCTETHVPRRIVVTGGPDLQILPESAGIVFGGGFPRRADVAGRKAAQRAIFYVQRELEEAAIAGNPEDNHQNPLRTESAIEAAEVDVRILGVWNAHPRRFIVGATPDFLAKAARVLELLRTEFPECCRHHVIPVLGEQAADTSQERRAS